jgi:hypothetical protein
VTSAAEARAFRARINELERRRTQLRHRAEKAEQERDELRAERDELRADVEQGEREIADLHDDRHRLAAELAEKGAECDRMLDQNEQLRRQSAARLQLIDETAGLAEDAVDQRDQLRAWATDAVKWISCYAPHGRPREIFLAQLQTIGPQQPPGDAHSHADSPTHPLTPAESHSSSPGPHEPAAGGAP